MSTHSQINDQIQDRFVSVVTLEGEFIDKIAITDALNRAEDAGFDLIMVSPAQEDKLSVCRIADYGKMKYEETKKNKHQQKKEHIKEMKFSINIANHDLQTKHHKILDWLEKGKKVRYIIEFRGRERMMKNTAIELIKDHLSAFDEACSWTEPKISEGKKLISVSSVLTPIEK